MVKMIQYNTKIATEEKQKLKRVSKFCFLEDDHGQAHRLELCRKVQEEKIVCSNKVDSSEKFVEKNIKQNGNLNTLGNILSTTAVRWIKINELFRRSFR